MRTNNKSLFAIAGALLLVLAASAGAAEKAKKRIPNKPIPTDAEMGFFDNTRDELRASIKRVGLMPTRLPEFLGDRPDAEKAVLDAVSGYLTKAGFEVVGPETYLADYDRFNRQLGGTYDAKTGILKAEVSRTVYQNARREFIAKERLDAYVLMTVKQDPASFFGDNATWAGVRERGNNAGTGTLPALSLLVQIVTSQGRVAFGRHGGIQLISYSIPAQGFDFAYVRSEDLMRDNVRIDRAARVATLPLVLSPKQITYGFHVPEINAEKMDLDKLPPPPVAKKNTPASPLKVPREQILGSVKRVALSPLNTGDFDVPDDVKSQLTDLVRAELQPLNWEIVDSPKIRTSMVSKMLVSQLFDPFTGKRDEERLKEIRKSVFKELGTETPPDAIMWLRVVRKTALQRSADVEWDGVDQNAMTRGPVVRQTWGGSANTYAGTSGIAASSIHVYLTDANDTTLYDSYGGIELLQTLKITPPGYYTYSKSEPVDLAPSELFRDTSRQQQAVHAAIRGLTMTPEEIQAEYARLHPEPRKPQKGYKKKKKA